MRVIAGEFRSRPLVAPAGNQTRPTPDRLREALFSALGDRVEGCVFFDGYAGSGSVGIEAISRGAKRAIFVEKHPQALTALRANLDKLRVNDRALVICGTVAKVLAQQATKVLAQPVADIVFLDPPYDRETEYPAAMQAVVGCKLLLVQHSVRLSLPEVCGELGRFRQMKQGDNIISFYEKSTGTPGQTASDALAK